MPADYKSIFDFFASAAYADSRTKQNERKGFPLMHEGLQVTLGLLIPLLGTTLGAAAVFFLRRAPGAWISKALLGFAAGVMLAASVWSLLLPSIDMACEQGVIRWIPAVVGFFSGVFFLLALDALAPTFQKQLAKPDETGQKTGQERKKSLLLFAVTLHNIPEGMAVGVIFAGFLADPNAVSATAAFALSFGIAIQNIPEGSIISMPLLPQGVSRPRAFLRGFLSGAVEPIAALLSLLLATLITPVLPYILSFAAGAMIYVAVEELIPEAQAGERTGMGAAVGTLSISAGFALMMLLDVALG